MKIKRLYKLKRGKEPLEEVLFGFRQFGGSGIILVSRRVERIVRTAKDNMLKAYNSNTNKIYAFCLLVIRYHIKDMVKIMERRGRPPHKHPKTENRKKLPILLLLWLPFFLYSCQQSNPLLFSYYTYQKANKYYQNQSYSKSAKVYQNLLDRLSKDDNNYYKIQYNYALSLAQQQPLEKNTLENVSRLFFGTLKINDEQYQTESFYNQGNTHLLLQKPNEAIEAYKKTLLRDPNHLNAKYNLQVALEMQKQQQTNNDKPEPRENQEDKQQDQTNQNENEQSKNNPESNNEDKTENKPNGSDNPNENNTSNKIDKEQTPAENQNYKNKQYQQILEAIANKEKENYKNIIRKRNQNPNNIEEDW